MDSHGFAQEPARILLARHGVAAIWLLHLAAARAYREGNIDAAVSVIEIADAAEREWLWGVGAVRGVGSSSRTRNSPSAASAL